MNSKTSGSHDCRANSGSRLTVRMTKWRLLVSPASRPMNTTAAKLSALTRVGAQAYTAIMRPTMAGIMTMIRISRIANIGFLIGWSGDPSDNNPIVSVTA